MDIQLPEILFQMINFGVVAGALVYFLYKPVKKMLDDRSDKVEEAQKAAELTLAEKRQIDDLKKKIQKDAEKEAAKILTEARESAEKMEAEVMESAKSKAKAEVQRQYKEWQAEQVNLVKQLKANFAKEVANMTEQILGTALDEKIINNVVDKNLEEIIQKI
jgi:F-type H+-transporting ATPase subunit b